MSMSCNFIGMLHFRNNFSVIVNGKKKIFFVFLTDSGNWNICVINRESSSQKQVTWTRYG